MNNKKYNIVEVVEGDSKHHLFDYNDVRRKLIELFGEPKDDDEHELLHRRIKKCVDVIPVFVINKKVHDDYHKKYTVNPEMKVNPSKCAIKRIRSRARSKVMAERADKIKSQYDFKSGFNHGWKQVLITIERRSKLEKIKEW